VLKDGEVGANGSRAGALGPHPGVWHRTGLGLLHVLSQSVPIAWVRWTHRLRIPLVRTRQRDLVGREFGGG
jgi:hypothetical protein